MSTEGDEESFVILGTSPTDLISLPGHYDKNGGSNLSSLNSGNGQRYKTITSNHINSMNADTNGADFSLLSDNQGEITTDNTDASRKFNNSSYGQSEEKKSSISNKSNESNSIKMPSFSKMNSDFKNMSISQGSNRNSLPINGTSNISAQDGSLAASFLMGDVQLDVLKATLHSQFPSLCSSSVKTEEMIKLQNILVEYIELKETLQKNNVAMRKYFTMLQKLQDDFKTQKEENTVQAQQIKEFQENFAKIRNENLELRKELGDKIEQIEINETLVRKENEDITKNLSDKMAQIQNMASHIEKLEQQHLDSFEYIRQLKTEHEEEKENKNIEHEYVPILEHKRIINDLEQRLSEICAKNFQLDEMKDQYQEEIGDLKRKLSVCENKLLETQTDLNVIKSDDLERKKHFETYEKERDEMRNEVLILKTQVEIYSKDFEMERVARQNLAGEKEKILTDLRLLQKRNQELLENSKKHFESRGNSSNSISQRSSPQRNDSVSTSMSSERDEQIYEPSLFICPLCSREFKLINHLQTHVQECIDT